MSQSKKQSSSFNRRDFLKTGALSGLFLGSGAFLNGCSSQTTKKTKPGDVKNIIFLVSDGMSTGTLTATDQLLRARYDRPSHWISLYEQGRVNRGLMDMTSATSVVTDSAAAACSWGCGRRMINGRVNIDENDQPVKPILKICKEAGKSTGLVTTATVTHATPAGFAANVIDRGDEQTIALQYLDREYDVILGGGARHMDSNRREDGRDLFAEFASAGYHVAKTKSEMEAHQGRQKLLGTFYSGHLPYNIDHIHSEDYLNTIPTLAEMTEKALSTLSLNPEGFIVQIEGARVDHAAHSNDVSGLIYDQIAFDDAVAAAVAFAENRDDTLIIITTDHGNANPALNGAGPYYNSSADMFSQVADFKQSTGWLLHQLNENSSVSQIREMVEHVTTLQIKAQEAEYLQRALAGRYQAIYSPMSGASQVMGQILANYTAFNWVGDAHTSDYVELAAMGAGQEYIGAFTRNTDLFDLMVELTGMHAYAAS
ncbi:alkaline phosphatase [Balneolaceae bacterium ANBcel3]|nr:alkaline phosphatase [Balneolaceae bacterium ANBcel3]